MPHDTSTPNRPDTNGVAELAVKEAVQGTQRALEQAGFPSAWWDPAVRHYGLSHSIELIEGSSAWFRRFNKHWTGPVLPFGCRVFFRPSPYYAEDQQKFEPAARAGLFILAIIYSMVTIGNAMEDY